MGRLTTHVLDTAHGCPAAGMHIELWRLDPPDGPQILQTTTTNRDGRTDQPLLEGEALHAGRYQLVFAVASYFRSRSVELPDPPFLDQVVLQFGVADPQAHYHVPLLTSPWAYSTYRGS